MYAAGWEWNANGSLDSEPKEVPRPEFEHWSEIIRRQAASSELNDVTEFCYFLDDLYDAALRITWEIEMMHEPTAIVDWSEIFREIMHIRDHFDSAEMMILNCINPAID